MKTPMLYVPMVALLFLVATAPADDKTQATQNAKTAPPTAKATAASDTTPSTTTTPNAVASDASKSAADEMHCFLGVSVAPLHESFVSHLEHLIGKGRGVLVTDVAKDSPAEKAGLKAHDILVSYDDQHLYSPDQLSKLIHNDKSGREVTLNFVRASKQHQVKVALGECPLHSQPRNPAHAAMERRQRYSHEPDQNADNQWSSFDSLTLTRTGAGKFKAEIKYENDKGSMDTAQFEGTRDELRKDINDRKDLPENEREHLLRALNLTSNGFENQFPNVFFLPEDMFWNDWR